MDEQSTMLHEIDLHQIERLRKLGQRLARDLQVIDGYTTAISAQESRADFIDVGLDDPARGADGEARESPEQAILHLQANQTRVLQAMKKAVWDVGRMLVRDSKRWKAAVEPPLEEEDADAA